MKVIQSSSVDIIHANQRFWEQYEMAMPLWLPSAELWSKIHAIGEFRYSVFAQRWFAQLTRENPGEEHCLPLPVFFHTDVPKHG